jgi:hypothetical protein
MVVFVLGNSPSPRKLTLFHAASRALMIHLRSASDAWRESAESRLRHASEVWKGGVLSLASRELLVVRDIFGNPFRPGTFSPEWRTETVRALAQRMDDTDDFSVMPILADALQDAGCDSADILDHCRGPGPHVRGCWVVDLVLGKE